MASKIATMTDIAKAAGVSQSTVSMILNGKGTSFPPETISRVLNTASSMNYHIRHRQSSSSARTIMVISAQATNPYYLNMLQGIERASAESDIRVLAVFTYHDSEKEASFLKFAIEHRLTGVIFLYAPDNEEAYSETAAALPIISVSDRASIFPGDVIQLNNFNAGVLAAEHLLNLGHKKLAVLSHRGKGKSSSSRDTRISGIISAVSGKIPDSDLLILTSNDPPTGYLDENGFHYHVGYSLAQNKKLYSCGITGIICVNDLVAYGAIDAISSKGYRVPEDFSVIGSDNLLYSGMSRVSLSTIEHHADAIAESAFSSLMMRVNSAVPSQSSAVRVQIQNEPSLIIRSSTAAVRTHELAVPPQNT